MNTKAIISAAIIAAILPSAAFAADNSLPCGHERLCECSQMFDDEDYTITLDANGGLIGNGYVDAKIEIAMTTKKGKIKLPLPYRDSDYEFEGWYTADDIKASSETVYRADVKLYAKWRITGTRTITFSSDGGSDILPITGTYLSSANIDGYVPVKEGYTFLGWYDDPQTKENKITEVIFDEDKTLYAKWEQKSRTPIVIGRDHMYMTDGEIAAKQEWLQSEYEPKLTEEQIKRIIELLNRFIQMYNK
ncbi:MAG: InlB B-repeat-containing protein [Clostridia bacterium]|nr:InlB B-repeat-containing protein [Clostridia bacterium]